MRAATSEERTMDWQRSRRTGSAAPEDPTVAILRASPAFAGCDEAALHRISSLGTEVRRPPGAVVQRPSATLRQALVVLEGVLAERPAHGRERAVSAGHVVGEDALTRTNAVGRTTATAVTEVRLLVLGRAELGEVAELLRVAPTPVAQPAARRVPEPTWGVARPAVA
jgi:hypothetical protein